jgi:excisionase family DNA binding protein
VISPDRCYRPREVVEATHCPRALVYASLDDGSLRAIRRGRSWLIPGAAVLAWLEGMAR